MSFPDLVFSTAPVRESDADAILLALPPLDRDDAPALEDWPGLREALLGDRLHRRARRRSSASTRPRARQLPLAVVGTGADPDAAAVRDAVGAGIRLLTGFATVARRRARRRRDAVARGRGGSDPRRLPLRRLQDRGAEAPRVARHRARRRGAGTRGAGRGRRLRRTRSRSSRTSSRSPPSGSARPTSPSAPSRRSPTFRSRSRCSTRPPCAMAVTAASSASVRDPTGRRAWCVSTTRPPDATRHVALVGKGITFDTGGLSLKPAGIDGRHEVRHVRRRDGTRGAPRRRDARPARPGHRLAVHRRQHAVRSRDAARAMCCACSTARRSRCSTPMPRAGSCSRTASSRRAASIPM